MVARGDYYATNVNFSGGYTRNGNNAKMDQATITASKVYLNNEYFGVEFKKCINPISEGLFGLGLGSSMIDEAARGLTTTTSTSLKEIKAARIIGNVKGAATWARHASNMVTFALNIAIVFNDPSNRNIARASVSTVIIAMNAVPVLGAGLSIGFGLIDAAGGFNWF